MVSRRSSSDARFRPTGGSRDDKAALGSVQWGVGEGVVSSLPSPEPPQIEALDGALVNDCATVPREG